MRKNIMWYMITLALLGACVPSKKYKDLEARYKALNDSTSTQIKLLEANNAILNQELDTLKKERALLEQKNATLQSGNEKSVAMLNKMMQDYTVLEKEHITLLKNSAQEASHKRKALEENQQKLLTSSELLRKYRQQIFKLQNQLSSQEEVISQKDNYKSRVAEDDNPVDLRTRIVAKIPEEDRKYFNIEVNQGKVFIEIVDSVLFENDQNKLTKHGEELLANLRNILKEYNLSVQGNDENEVENDKNNQKVGQVARLLQSSNGKVLKEDLPASNISKPSNPTSLLHLKNRKNIDKSPVGKTLIVVSEED